MLLALRLAPIVARCLVILVLSIALFILVLSIALFMLVISVAASPYRCTVSSYTCY